MYTFIWIKNSKIERFCLVTVWSQHRYSEAEGHDDPPAIWLLIDFGFI